MAAIYVRAASKAARMVLAAEDIDLDEPNENLGAQLVKEAASKTNEVAGDGTTTATVLSEAIFREGLKMIAAGADPMALSRGISKATDAMGATGVLASAPVVLRIEDV